VAHESGTYMLYPDICPFYGVIFVDHRSMVCWNRSAKTEQFHVQLAFLGYKCSANWNWICSWKHFVVTGQYKEWTQNVSL